MGLFLEDRIGFLDIASKVRRAMEEMPNVAEPTLEEILAADQAARESVYRGT